MEAFLAESADADVDVDEEERCAALSDLWSLAAKLRDDSARSPEDDALTFLVALPPSALLGTGGVADVLAVGVVLLLSLPLAGGVLVSFTVDDADAERGGEEGCESVSGGRRARSGDAQRRAREGDPWGWRAQPCP